MPPEAKASSVGAVGCCMGGPFVIAAAARYPNRIKCIASVHGAQLVTDRDDSPHLMPDKVRCETCVACAEHGFVFPKRAGICHLPSAERHWERLFALFARNLSV